MPTANSSCAPPTVATACYLQAKVREQHDDLVIIELSSYLDTGGAHGDARPWLYQLFA
jgi:hypothetical protein